MAYKVFSNGSVLNASEINDNLMNQSVMVFSNAAARTAAITSPVEGMLTWLEDVNRFENYSGSAWVPGAVGMSSGLVHLRTVTFNGVSSISLGSDADPVFSSAYNNYRIVVKASASTNADRTWSMRLRANTTDNSSNVYSTAAQGIQMSNGNAVNTNSESVSSFNILSNAYYATTHYSIFDCMAPFLIDKTVLVGGVHGVNVSTAFHQSFTGLHNDAASFNGFTLLNSSGNFTSGVVSVYGYRNA